MAAKSEWAAEPDLEALRVAYSHLRSDPARAMAEFEILANSGSLMSLIYIGDMYKDGLGVEKSLSKADEFYERAFAQGSVSAAHGLGQTSRQRRDYKRAEEHFTWGVQKNDPQAMYGLADLYLSGRVDREDWLSAAVALLERASSLGHPESAVVLAHMNAKEDAWAEPDLEALRVAHSHLHSDPVRAMAECEILANSGSLMSLVYIGYMYEEGLGVEKSLSKADRFYECAFVQGSVPAAHSLGRASWMRGDYKKAEEYFSWGVQKNDPRAMYWLAELYLRGHVSQDDRLNAAVALLERASSLGHLQSERRLAGILMFGRLGIAKFFDGLRMAISTSLAAARLIADEPRSDRLLDLPEDLKRPLFTPKSRR